MLSDQELAVRAQRVCDYVAARDRNGRLITDMRTQAGPVDGLRVALWFAAEDGLTLPDDLRTSAIAVLDEVEADRDGFPSLRPEDFERMKADLRAVSVTRKAA